MPKILESEALVLANSIDAAAPEDRPWMLDVLTRYQSQQFDNGEPEWPTQAQQQAEAETRFRSMFDAPEKVPYDPGPYAKDPNAERASYANAAFIANRYNVEFGEAVDRGRFYMDDYAAKKGQKSGLDDMAFYNLAKGEVAETKLAEDTRLEGAKAALRGEDGVRALSEWQIKNPDKNYAQFTQGFLKAQETAGDYLGIADELFSAMEVQAGMSKDGKAPTLRGSRADAKFAEYDKATGFFSQGNDKGTMSDVMARNVMSDIVDEMAGMKPREQKAVFQIINAKIEAAGYDQKGFWAQAMSGLDRGFGRLPSTIAGAFETVLGKIGSVLAVGEEPPAELVAGLEEADRKRAARGEVIDRISDVIGGKLDPVTATVGFLPDSLEKGMIRAPGAVLPFMAISATTGFWTGFGLMSLDFAEQTRRDLRAGGMDNAQAENIGLVAAPFLAGVEQLSNWTQLGRFPGLAKFAKPITGKGVQGAVRYGQNFLASLGVEMSEETLQNNLIVPAIQNIAAKFDEAIPGVGIGAIWDNIKRDAPDTFWTILPAALVFGGSMTMQEAELSDAATADRDLLIELGFSASQANETASKPTVEERVQTARSLWGVRAGTPITMETAAKNLSERMRQLQGDAVAQQQELERRGKLPIMRPIGDRGQWTVFMRDGSNATFDTIQEAQKARWDWTADQLGTLHKATRETLNSMERNLPTGRELTVEISPDARFATPEEMANKDFQDRIEQGKVLDGLQDAVAIDAAMSGDSVDAVKILGTSNNEMLDGVLRTTIRLYEGANILTLVEEKLEGDIKVILSDAEKRRKMIDRLREYEALSGDSIFADGITDENLTTQMIVEAWSHLGQSYLVGRSTFGEPLQAKTMRRFGKFLMGAKLMGAMNAEAAFFEAVVGRAKKLGELQKAGKLGADLTAELEKQLGIDSQVAHEAGAEAEARQLIDTSGYSEETPGPNGETFALAPLAMFTTKEQRDYAFGDGRYTHPVTLKNGTRLSGETFDFKWSDTDKMPTFFGYTKSGAEITIQAQYVTPDMVATSRDSGKSANDLRDRLEKWHARRGTNGETFSLASSPLKGTTGAWMDRSGALTVLTGNDTHDSAANKLTGLSGMNGFDELLNNKGFLRLKQAGWAGDNRLYFNGAPTLAQRSALKKLNEDFGYSVIQDNGERGERVIFGSETFSLSRATPADASNVVQMPDGARLVGPTTFSIRAFHGTPHKVDRFRTDKIGTGEGAQAYGYGLYFAESREVGEGYRDKLAQWTLLTSDGKIYDDRKELKNLNVRAVLNKNGSIEEAIARAKSVIESIPGTQGAELALADISTLEELKGRGGLTKTKGNLYTVELLPDEDQFLDWDKPLSEQSEKVKAALALELENAPESVFEGGVMVYPKKQLQEARSGEDFYFRLGNNQDASERLASLGIPGIRFLDGNSRSDGSGTSNYVIFDENLIRILEENGKPVGETFSVRVTPAQDAEYMAAVESGDVANQQAMVDAAAKAAGYNVGPVFHGTASKFDAFENKKTGRNDRGLWGLGHYFANSFERAKSYADRQGDGARIIQAFVSLKNPLVLKTGADLVIRLPDGTSTRDLIGQNLDGSKIKTIALDGGHDGVIQLRPNGEIGDLVVYSPNQIKSADPITRDADGNVIPLSKRFNPADDRITYSLRSGDFASQPSPGGLSEAEVRRLIKRPGLFWRVHSRNDSFTKDDAVSTSIDNLSTQKGFSTFDSAEDLLGYWTGDNPAGRTISHYDQQVIAFTGKQIGKGIDGEPLAMPDMREVFRMTFRDVRDALDPPAERLAKAAVEYSGFPDDSDKIVARMRDDPRAALVEFMKDDGYTSLEIEKTLQEIYTGADVSFESSRAADGTFSLRSGDFASRAAAMFSPFQRTPELRMAIARVAKERAMRLGAEWIEKAAKIRSASNIEAERKSRYTLKLNDLLGAKGMTLADVERSKDQKDYETWQRFQESKDLLMKSGLTEEEAVPLAAASSQKWRSGIVKNVKEAMRQAKAEADAWADKAKEKATSPKAQREALKAALRTLDGILSAAPPEVRAKVGGYVKLAGLATDEAMLQEIERRVAKLNVELEKWLKKEYLQRIAKLFKRFAPKKDDKGRITSNITAEAAEDIGFAFDFASLDDANQEKEMGSVEKTLEESEDAAEIQDAIGKLAIFQLFHNLEKRESSELEAAAMWLDELGSGAREARKIIDAARAEQVKAAKDVAKADASNGKLSSLPDAENVEAAAGTWVLKGKARSSTFKRFTNEVKGFLNYALFTMGQQLEIVFGQDSRITTEFHRRAVRAANDSTDIKRDIEARRAAFVADLFGTTSRIKQAGRMGALTVPTASGVIIATGGKAKTIDVPAEIVVRIIEGTADLKALGFTKEEAATLADAWADNEALPVKRQKRVFQIERRSDGKDVELTMSQDAAIQYLLWSNQKASREQMERDGWSKESFQQLNAFLSDDARALAKFFADEYARLGRLIEPVYRRMFHAPFPQVANYSPIFRDISKADSIIDIDQQGHGSGVSSGFILARNKNARSALRRTSAISAFMQHAESAAHWIAHVELVRDLRSVLIDKEVQNAIRSSGRTAAANGIKKRVMQLENQGKVGAAGIAELDSWGSRLLQARAFKGLAWRISPVMKQASAYFNPLLADVPAWDYMRGTARLLSGQLDVSAMWNSPDIQRRIESGFSAEARIAMDKLGYTGSTLLAAMSKGMLPMQLVDAGWTTAGAAVAFDYYRRNNIKSGMNETLAENAALDQLEMMIAESAQPADPANRSLIEGLQNPWLKSMWMFASESRKTLAVEIMALRRLATGKSKNKAMDVQRAVVAHVIMATTTQLMAGVLSLLMGDDDDREREWSVEEWAAAIAAGPINGLFLFGDAFNYIGRRLFGLHAFEPSTAIGQAVKAVTSAPSILDEAISGEPEEQRKAILKLGEAFGQAASIVGLGNPFTAVDVIIGNPLKDAEKILSRVEE